ncbi:FAD/NAD(P)-binding domain-containing protein [Daldinia grandis]|nr:FAD/NAD(P)-binding domain-containing protein [Daldinia grandis]
MNVIGLYSRSHIVIAGAGTAGLYMAYFMQRANIGFAVRLFDQVDLLNSIEELAFELHKEKRTYGVDRKVMVASNFRGYMQETSGKDTYIKTDAEIIDVITYAQGVKVQTKDRSIFEGSIVIGADGVYSKARILMQKLSEQSTRLNEGNPMLSSFYSILDAHQLQISPLSQKFYVNHERAGTIIQCTGTRHNLQFVTLTPLLVKTINRTSYARKEMESYATSIAGVPLCPGITGKLLKRWEYHDYIVLVGDAVYKGTSVNGLGVTCGLHSAAALANELQSLNIAAPNNPSTGLLGQAFARYQKVREGECRMVWSRRLSMICQATSTSFAKGIIVSLLLIRHGQVLSFVLFDMENGRVPWLRRWAHYVYLHTKHYAKRGRTLATR